MIEIKKPINKKNTNSNIDNEILFESLNKQEDIKDLFNKKEKKITISISMDKITYLALEKLAKTNNLNRGISKIVQKACEEFLEKYGAQK